MCQEGDDVALEARWFHVGRMLLLDIRENQADDEAGQEAFYEEGRSLLLESTSGERLIVSPEDTEELVEFLVTKYGQ